MGIFKVYWAWGGVSRPYSNYILKKKGNILCSGFSVEYPKKFSKILISKGVKMNIKRN